MKKQTTEKEKQLAEIQRILNLKGPEQWKAAQEFALNNNPSLAAEHQIHLKELETVREEQDRDDARSADGSLRFDLSMPATIFAAIRAFDPAFMMFDKRDKTRYKTKRSTNAEARKLMKVFPEYKIPRNG